MSLAVRVLFLVLLTLLGQAKLCASLPKNRPVFSVESGYDGNGNRLGRTQGTASDMYTYDAENRLIGLTKGGTSYAYLYDYRTRRVQRVEGSTTTEVVFSGGQSVSEYTNNTATGVLSAEYVRGSDWGAGVGGILYSVRSGTPSYAHYDRRGDVTARTTGGVITYQASYEAWGTRPQSMAAPRIARRRAPKREDPTGLINEGMRYRDLETGVFLTRDPAGMVDGPNLYAYVNQNPWTKFDPEGLWAGGDDAAASGIGALVGLGMQGVSDLWNHHLSSYKDYAASAVGGAAAGEAALYTGGLGSGAAYGAASNLTKQGLNNADGSQHGLNVGSLAMDTAVGAVAGKGGELVANAAAPLVKAAAGKLSTSIESSAQKTTAQAGQEVKAAAEGTAADLAGAAERAAQTVGEGSGPVYGTQVHSAFEGEVNALGNSNLATEQSYLNGNLVTRGTPGSVRLDVVEGPLNAPTAIFDLKTGSATLSPARILQIQSHLPGGSSVPVYTIRP